MVYKKFISWLTSWFIFHQYMYVRVIHIGWIINNDSVQKICFVLVSFKPRSEQLLRKRFFSSNSGAYHLFRLCSKCSIRSPEINHLFEVILYTRSTFYFDLDPDFRKCNSSFRCTYYWAHSPRVKKWTPMFTVVQPSSKIYIWDRLSHKRAVRNFKNFKPLRNFHLKL